MFKLRFLTVVALAITSLAPLEAQELEDPGAFPVGFRDVNFSSPMAVNDRVTARIFYPATSSGSSKPADPLSGPYPLVALVHGSGTFPFDYDQWANHVASMGFVVAAVGTLGDFQTTIPADTQALLHWVTAESLDMSSFLFGMASSDPWTAVGHSSGGIAIFALSAIEPLVENLIAMEPSYLASSAVDNFDGDLLVIGSSDDVVTPPVTNAELYFDNTDLAPRRLYVEVQGGGHYGSLDVPFGVVPPLAHSEQHRMHRRATAGFLRSEVLGEEHVYQDVLGAGASGEPIVSESQSDDTIQWVAESSVTAGSVAWGIARQPGDYAVWMAAPGTFSLPTIYGEFGLDPFTMVVVLTGGLSPAGTGELTAPIGASMSGQSFYFQSIAVGVSDGALSETVEFQLP